MYVPALVKPYARSLVEFTREGIPNTCRVLAKLTHLFLLSASRKELYSFNGALLTLETSRTPVDTKRDSVQTAQGFGERGR